MVSSVWVWFSVFVLFFNRLFWVYLLKIKLQTGCITWQSKRDICNIFATISIDLNSWWVQIEIPVYLGAQEDKKVLAFFIFKRKKSRFYCNFVFLLLENHQSADLTRTDSDLIFSDDVLHSCDDRNTQTPIIVFHCVASCTQKHEPDVLLSLN